MSTLVVGLGNSLMADDGAGVEVTRKLRERALPPSVRIVDADTDVLQLLSLWRGEEHVWLVDALASGAPRGTIHELDNDQVLALPQRHATAHFLSLPESLRWLALTSPELGKTCFRLWGIEVDRVEPRVGLTAEVEAAVEVLVERMIASMREI